MKQSHLYQRSQENLVRKQNQVPQKTGGSSALKGQLMEGVFKLMQFLVHGQQRIQTYKEMLTQRNNFSPEPLFQYLSKGEHQIDKKHLIQIFQENLLPIQQEYLKLYFNSYAFKEKIDYSAFINLIFPENTDLIKKISVTAIKKYSNQSNLCEDVLCIFLMLVQEQIRLLEGLDALKCQLIPKITRKQIKNVMRLMKKNGQCNSLMQIESQPFVKYEQLKTLFKNYASRNSKGSNLGKKMSRQITDARQDSKDEGFYQLLQRNSLSVFRRLSMGKTNFINMEDFEFWLRPWSKLRPISSSIQDFGQYSSNIIAISGIDQINDQSKVSQGQDLGLPLSHRGC